MEHLVSNAIAVSIAEVITLPICTIKTNYQVSKQVSLPNIIKRIYCEFGILGFYRATTSAVVSQTVSTTSKFTFYQLIKEYRLTKDNDIPNNMINGAAGGILGSLFAHPIDVLKSYQQRSAPFTPTLRNFYSGYSQAILKNILLYGALFPVYDFYQTKFQNIYISAPLTTITITLYLQPIDYIKQNLIAKTKPEFRNLYKGVSLNLLRSIPHFVITMTLTEQIKKTFTQN